MVRLGSRTRQMPKAHLALIHRPWVLTLSNLNNGKLLKLNNPEACPNLVDQLCLTCYHVSAGGRRYQSQPQHLQSDVHTVFDIFRWRRARFR